jgi:hypothetical protein
MGYLKLFEGEIAMRKFKVLGTRHYNRHIEVTKYTKTANGVHIEIAHNVPTVAGKVLQWVQTVSDNGSFFKDCRLNPHVDPYGKGGAVNTVNLPGFPGECKADDLMPFYYTEAEIKAGSGATLNDTPGESPPASGRTWTNFVTALTEVTDKTVHHLVAITWGYDLFPDGTVKENGIHRATREEMKAHGETLKRMYPTYRYT